MSAVQQDKISLEALAQAILETVPLAMRSLRKEMRSRSKVELSTPQFRVLGYVRSAQSASLSQIAEHMALTLPSASQMIDGLASRGFLARVPNAIDRRRVAISLTDRGLQTWQAAFDATRAALVHGMRTLNVGQQNDLMNGLDVLASIFRNFGNTQ